MKTSKTQKLELRDVTKRNVGGYKMKKKKRKTKARKRKTKNNVINIVKDSVSLTEYILRRNERIVKLESEDVEEPKHPCITCRYFINGRCERMGRPITQPMLTKCFKHSLYPQPEERIYLVHESIEAEIIEITPMKGSEQVS